MFRSDIFFRINVNIIIFNNQSEILEFTFINKNFKLTYKYG